MQHIAAACDCEILQGRGLRAKERGHLAAGYLAAGHSSML